jgi:hypothetical protein
VLRVLDRISLPALLLYLVWGLVSEWLRAGTLSTAIWDDYAILRDFGRQTIASSDYLWQFEGEGPFVVYLYTPAAALLHATLARLGDIGGLVWMAAIALCAVLGVRATLRLLGWEDRPGRYVATLLAVLACGYFVRFDLHFLNGNVIFVGLALLGLERMDRSPQAGAVLLATSMLIKPYSVLLLPYLALIGRGDVLLRSCAALFALGLLLPALALGPSSTFALYSSWLGAISHAGSSDFLPQIAAFNISTVASVQALATSHGIDAVGTGARWLTRALHVAWLATLTWALWPRVAALRAGLGRAERVDGATLLAESGVLLVAPLALSPMFQPHHGVALVPLAMLLATQAFEVTARTGLRWRSGLLGSALFVAGAYLPHDGTQGLGVLACMGALVAATRSTTS